MCPSPKTVPSGMGPVGLEVSTTAWVSFGCKDAGPACTPSLAVVITCVAMAWAVSIEKRDAKASINIGRFIPVKIAHVSS